MIRLKLRITRSAGKEKSTSMPKPSRLKSPLATLLCNTLTGSDQTSETLKAGQSRCPSSALKMHEKGAMIDPFVGPRMALHIAQMQET